MKAIRCFVSGHVQGVFFRQSCRLEARQLNLFGWVRNLPDGRVEVFAQGEQDGLDRFTSFLWMGPDHARVTGVETDAAPVDPDLGDFHIHPNPDPKTWEGR